MNAQQEIKNAQKKWAERHGKLFHQSHRYPYYLDSVDANLREPLSSHAQKGLDKGRGSELRDRGRTPAKMKALHSSSVLVANVFDYWTDVGDKRHLLEALGIPSGNAIAFGFEKKFPTGLGGTPPHLDVAIRLDSGQMIGIESKFTEHFDSVFSPRYFPSTDNLWKPRGLSVLRDYAEELCEMPNFHPEQLLKHALGIAKEHTSKFTLYYLYYDWDGEIAKAHEREINIFAERVKPAIDFQHLSYQELYRHLANSLNGNAFYSDYLAYLHDRYFSDPRAGVTS